MAGIIGLIALLTVLALSLLITRLATIALTVTGLSKESARFQARSAFTGTGFTTREAEQVVGHPVRRRIIMWLMIVRSAGFVSIIISLILSFVGGPDGDSRLWRLVWLAIGVGVLWAMAANPIIDRLLGRAVRYALTRWTDLDVRDYASLLHLSGDYSVMEVQMEKGDWLVGKQIKDCNLRSEGVNILGIYRDDGTFVGVPQADTEVYAGDTLILYGRARALSELDRRRAGSSGDAAHARATSEQAGHMAEQQRQEAETRRRKEVEEADQATQESQAHKTAGGQASDKR